ncbi:MAG: hypothetical protein ACXQTP_05585 [Candidatus Methanofastidiosia archaeon]
MNILIPLIIFLFFFSILNSDSLICCYPQDIAPGKYATYEFSADINVGNIRWLYCTGTVGWRCEAVEGDMARMTQWIDFTVPTEYIDPVREEICNNSLYYAGKECVEMAKKGDFSFVSWFPGEDISLKEIYKPYVITDPATGEQTLIEEYGVDVYISGEYYFEETFDIDLSSREVYDLEGNAVGRWLWWINPEQYPFEGETEELLRHDWFGRKVWGEVVYLNRETIDPKLWDIIEQRANGAVTEIFSLYRTEIEDYEIGDSEDPLYLPPVSISIQYSAATGFPLWPYGVGLCDDVTYGMTGGLDFSPSLDKEGAVMFTLQDTNLTVTESYNAENKSSMVVYVSLVLIVIMGTGVIFFSLKRGYL